MITFELVTEPPPPPCPARRGKRGRMTCEREAGHADFHAGRGQVPAGGTSGGMTSGRRDLHGGDHPSDRAVIHRGARRVSLDPPIYTCTHCGNTRLGIAARREFAQGGPDGEALLCNPTGPGRQRCYDLVTIHGHDPGACLPCYVVRRLGHVGV